METMEAGNHGMTCSKYWKILIGTSRILYLAEIPFKNEEEISIFQLFFPLKKVLRELPGDPH